MSVIDTGQPCGQPESEEVLHNRKCHAPYASLLDNLTNSAFSQ